MQEYINSKIKIQKEILSLFADDQNGDKVYINPLLEQIKDQKILEDEDEFRSLLHLISNIAKNHHRSPNFFDIIEKILIEFKDEYKKYLTNQELFYIFHDNKLVLYILLQNKILEFNEHISYYILYSKSGNVKYFINEIKPLVEKDFLKGIDEIDQEFYEQNRKKGENEEKICEFIRNDKIEDFIIYVNKNNISVNNIIKKSIYETNYYLENKEPTLIEYAAFYGSIQIFNYLRMNGAYLNSTLWFYVVHGGNAELIHFLESNQIEPKNKSYQKVYEESLFCHHNEIAEYIKMNYLNDKENCLYAAISSYNYECMPKEDLLLFEKKKTFCYFCHFDYYFLVKSMLDNIIYDAEYQEYFNCGYELYYTPFLAAVLNNNIKIVKQLINRPEIDLNSKAIKIKNLNEHNEMNALRMAIFNYNTDLIELLLYQNKIDVNSRLIVKKMYKNQKGTMIIEDIYPISIAISYRDKQIVNMLLKHEKIDVNVKFIQLMDFGDESTILINNETVLCMAYNLVNIEMVKLVLTHPNLDINAVSTLKKVKDDVSIDLDFIQNLLCLSIEEENFELTKLLLNCKNIDVNSKSIYEEKNFFREEKSALYLAIQKENEEIVKELLNHKEIDVNFKYIKLDVSISEHEEKSVLQFAFEKGNENIIKLLLENSNIDVNVKSLWKKTKGINAEVEEKTTLSYAINLGNIEIMKILLKKPDLNLRLKNKKLLIQSNYHQCEEKNILEMVNENNSEMFQFLLKHLKQLYEDSGDKQIKEIISNYK